MKRIGSLVGDVRDPSLRSALKQMEGSRAAQGQGPGKVKEAPNVASLERTRAARIAADAALLEALARRAGMDPKAASQLADGIRAQTPNDWTFVMLSPAQNDAVVQWIAGNSQRPFAAMRLWSRLFVVMRRDTGEVMASRAELANHLGIAPRHVSTILSELTSINAVRREKEGRRLRLFMNSNVATHLPGPELRKRSQEADGPLLVAMQGGRPDPS